MENEKNTSNFKIIPSVKEVKYLKKAIQSDNLCIQLTGVHIGNLQLKSVYLIATRDLRISGCNFFYLKIKGLCDFLRKRF